MSPDRTLDVRGPERKHPLEDLLLGRPLKRPPGYTTERIQRLRCFEVAMRAAHKALAVSQQLEDDYRNGRRKRPGEVDRGRVELLQGHQGSPTASGSGVAIRSS